MKFVFLDTETTDIKPGQICQLTYIVQEPGKALKAVNKFLAVDEVSAGAEAVHGFSKFWLDIQSEGQTFKDIASELASDLSGAIMVAHNTAFDYRFLDAEYVRLGIPNPVTELFCTMQFFTNICKIPRYSFGHSFHRPITSFKWPTLTELAAHLRIDISESIKMQKQLFSSDKTAHDARFDTTLLMQCFNRSGAVRDHFKVVV